MSKSKVSTLLAALAIIRDRRVRGGLRQQQRQTAPAGGGGGEKLTVGSDIPYPPFEQGQSQAELHRLRHRTDGSDRRKDRARRRNSRTPRSTRSSATSRQGKFEAVVSAATITDEREKTVDFTNPYYLSEQAILVKEGSDDRSGIEDLEGKTVGAQQGTTGSNRQGKSQRRRTPPLPEGPDAINALKAGTVEAVVIDTPVAENAVEDRRRPRNRRKSPDRRKYGFAVATGQHELLERNQRRPEEVIEDGTYTKIYEKWFHHEPPEMTSATHEASNDRRSLSEKGAPATAPPLRLPDPTRSTAMSEFFNQYFDFDVMAEHFGEVLERLPAEPPDLRRRRRVLALIWGLVLALLRQLPGRKLPAAPLPRRSPTSTSSGRSRS